MDTRRYVDAKRRSGMGRTTGPRLRSVRGTANERDRALPGDPRIPRAIDTLTHGVTIRRRRMKCGPGRQTHRGSTTPEAGVPQSSLTSHVDLASCRRGRLDSPESIDELIVRATGGQAKRVDGLPGGH